MNMILFGLVTNTNDEMSAVFTQNSPYHRQCKINSLQHHCQDTTELLYFSMRTRMAEDKEMGVEALLNKSRRAEMLGS